MVLTNKETCLGCLVFKCLVSARNFFFWEKMSGSLFIRDDPSLYLPLPEVFDTGDPEKVWWDKICNDMGWTGRAPLFDPDFATAPDDCKPAKSFEMDRLLDDVPCEPVPARELGTIAVTKKANGCRVIVTLDVKRGVCRCVGNTNSRTPFRLELPLELYFPGACDLGCLEPKFLAELVAFDSEGHELGHHGVMSVIASLRNFPMGQMCDLGVIKGVQKRTEQTAPYASLRILRLLRLKYWSCLGSMVICLHGDMLQSLQDHYKLLRILIPENFAPFTRPVDARFFQKLSDSSIVEVAVERNSRRFETKEMFIKHLRVWILGEDVEGFVVSTKRRARVNAEGNVICTYKEDSTDVKRSDFDVKDRTPSEPELCLLCLRLQFASSSYFALYHMNNDIFVCCGMLNTRYVSGLAKNFLFNMKVYETCAGLKNFKSMSQFPASLEKIDNFDKVNSLGCVFPRIQATWITENLKLCGIKFTYEAPVKYSESKIRVSDLKIVLRQFPYIRKVNEHYKRALAFMDGIRPAPKDDDDPAVASSGGEGTGSTDQAISAGSAAKRRKKRNDAHTESKVAPGEEMWRRFRVFNSPLTDYKAKGGPVCDSIAACASVAGGSEGPVAAVSDSVAGSSVSELASDTSSRVGTRLLSPVVPSRAAGTKRKLPNWGTESPTPTTSRPRTKDKTIVARGVSISKNDSNPSSKESSNPSSSPVNAAHVSVKKGSNPSSKKAPVSEQPTGTVVPSVSGRKDTSAIARTMFVAPMSIRHKRYYVYCLERFNGLDDKFKAPNVKTADVVLYKGEEESHLRSKCLPHVYIVNSFSEAEFAIKGNMTLKVPVLRRGAAPWRASSRKSASLVDVDQSQSRVDPLLQTAPDESIGGGNPATEVTELPVSSDASITLSGGERQYSPAAVGDLPDADGDPPVADGDPPVADGDPPVADGGGNWEDEFAVMCSEERELDRFDRDSYENFHRDLTAHIFGRMAEWRERLTEEDKRFVEFVAECRRFLCAVEGYIWKDLAAQSMDLRKDPNGSWVVACQVKAPRHRPPQYNRYGPFSPSITPSHSDREDD